jgi:hypothetical protein
MSTKELIELIQDNIEWLSTTEGDEVECISIENLESILTNYFRTQIKLTQDGN